MTNETVSGEKSPLVWALAYLTLGWHPIPLCWPDASGACACPKRHTNSHEIGKAPLLGDGFDSVRATEELVRQWWGVWPQANIGILLEPSGILLVDTDSPDAVKEVLARGVPYSPNAQSAAGQHFYYRAPADLATRSTRQGESKHIDILSLGYVVAPPSLHRTGITYRWLVKPMADLPEPPAWATDILQKVVRNRTNAVLTQIPDVLPETDIDTLPVAPWVREVIRTGERADDLLRYDSRSEALFAVIEALIAAYVDDGQIAAVCLDPAYVISEKPREQGRKWLANEIRRAHEKAGIPDLRAVPAIYIEERPESASEAPETPYTFTSAFPPDHFVARWVDYAFRQSHASCEYHEAMALALLSSTMPGIRCGITPNPRMSANIYLLLIGETTIAQKTTAMRLAGRVLREAIPGVLTPDDMTPQGLRDELAPKMGNPTTWFRDEFGKLFQQMKRKDYLAGLDEFFLKLFDGDDLKTKRGTKREKNGESGKVEAVKDEVEIKNPHFTFVGVATPQLRSDVSQQDIGEGLIPRFAIIWPDVYPDPLPRGYPQQQDDAERHQFIEELRARISWVEQYSPDVEWSDDAMTVLNAFEIASIRDGNEVLRRYRDMAWKLAMISAWGREDFEQPVLTITVEDAQHALKLLDRWKRGQVRFAETTSARSAREREVSEVADAVMAFIKDRGGEQQSVIMRRFRMSAEMCQRVYSTLHGQDLIDQAKLIRGGTARKKESIFWGTSAWISSHMSAPEASE